MTRTIRRLSLVASLLVAPAMAAALLTEAPARAAESQSATAFLKAKQDALIKLLKSTKGADRTTKVNAELATFIDYDAMAQASLGDEWGKRSDAEKKQFTDLLRQLIEKNYTKRMDDLADYDVAYKSETASGTDTTVKTEAKNRKDNRAAPVMVDYVLRKKNGSFVIVDIIPEGSSYVKTYNKEFAKFLKTNSWDKLIEKMKKKIAEP